MPAAPATPRTPAPSGAATGPAPRTTSGRAWVPCAVAAVVALAVRLVVLSQLRAADPLLRVEALDDRVYLEMARRMAAGHADPWFLAPVFPWLLAQAGRFAAIDLGTAGVVNAVLGAATAAVSAATARALHSQRAAWVAGLAYALLGAFVFDDVIPGQEPALALLHVAGLAAALGIADARPARSLGAAAALAVLTAVAMLGRATSLALVLAGLPALLRLPWRRRLAVLAVGAAGVAAVLVPVAFRNLSVAGGFTPFQWGSGTTLYNYNGPDARATGSGFASELGVDPDEIARNATAIAERAEGRDLTPAEVSAWWTRRTWADRGSVSEMAVHLLRKAVLFWTAVESPCNHWPDGERDYATWLRVVPVSVWWILALGGGGWWLLRGRRDGPGTGPPGAARPPGPSAERARIGADGAALVVAGTWALLVVAFPMPRYRLPVAAVACVIASCGVVEVLRGRPPFRRAAVAALIVAGIAALAFVRVRDEYLGIGRVNLAVAHWELGDPPRKVREQLDLALAAEPDCGPAFEVRGRLRAATGDPKGALDDLRRAFDDVRSAWRARVSALPVLCTLGRLDDADALARELLSKDDRDPDLLANAAIVAFARGDRARAAELLGAAQAIDPARPSVLHAAEVLRR